VTWVRWNDLTPTHVHRRVALELTDEERKLGIDITHALVTRLDERRVKQVRAVDVARNEAENIEGAATLLDEGPQRGSPGRPVQGIGSTDGDEVDSALLERREYVLAVGEVELVVVGEDPRIARARLLDRAEEVCAPAYVQWMADDTQVQEALGPARRPPAWRRSTHCRAP